MQTGLPSLSLQGSVNLPLLEQPLLQGHSRRPSTAQRSLSLPEPAVTMAGHKCLEKMLSGQKEINHGGGGLVDAPTPEVLTEYRRSGLKLPTARNLFSLAPHEPSAESLLHAMFDLHCEELAAQQLLHKSQTAQAMVLTARCFTGPALHQWTVAKAWAEETATTTGIGNGSTLYRAAVRMLKAYENTQAVYQTRKALKSLTWGKSVALTMATWEVVLREAAAVAKRTAASDPSRRLRLWDFDDTLAALREAPWPDWCEQLCIKSPGDFTTLADVWKCLLTHEPLNMGSMHRQVLPPTGRRLGVNMLQEYCASGQDTEHRDMLALAALDALHRGEFDMACHLLKDDPLLLDSVQSHVGATPDGSFIRGAENAHIQGAIFALSNTMASNGRPLTCWRCGKKGHRRVDCPDKPSVQEIAGAPRQTWTRAGGGGGGFTQMPSVSPAPVLQMAVAASGQDDVFISLVESMRAMAIEVAALKSASVAQLSFTGPPPQVMQITAPAPASHAAMPAIAASLCCMPRGLPAPMGFRHVGEDSAFSWFALLTDSDDAVSAALDAWPAGNDAGAV